MHRVLSRDCEGFFVANDEFSAPAAAPYPQNT